MQPPRWFFLLVSGAAVIAAVCLLCLTLIAVGGRKEVARSSAPSSQWERLSDRTILETGTGRVCHVAAYGAADCASAPAPGLAASPGATDR